MRGRCKLSISAIRKNWDAVQNTKKTKKLPRHTTKTLSNSSFENKAVLEEACFHVFVRGFNSYTLFYDREDRVHFLLILDEEAKRVHARILAFILMDNHFHLQVVTAELTNLMKISLRRYSARFRLKYGINGAVFDRPFGRSQIFSLLLAKENLLYILSNASRENICATHRDYVWSSYSSHPEVIRLRLAGMLQLPMLVPRLEQVPNFGLGSGRLEGSKKVICAQGHSDCSSFNGKNCLPAPKRCRGSVPSAEVFALSDVGQLLKVDTSFMVSSFRDLEDLDYAIHSYEPLKKKLLNTQALDAPSSKQIYHYNLTPYYEVIDFFMDLMDGRKFSMITDSERTQMIKTLKSEKGATRRQISSILRIQY